MKKSLLLSLSILMTSYLVFAGGAYSNSVPESNESESVKMTKEQFDNCKQQLPQDLSNFVSDFEQWPKTEKDKIQLIGLSFFIDNNCNQEIKDKYGNNPGYWIDCRTNTQQKRKNFIACLEYLKQK